jgi:hypothetical protein
MSKKIKAKNKHGNHLVRGKSRKRAGNAGIKRLDLKRDTLLFPGVSDYRRRPRSLEEKERFEALIRLFG